MGSVNSAAGEMRGLRMRGDLLHEGLDEAAARWFFGTLPSADRGASEAKGEAK